MVPHTGAWVKLPDLRLGSMPGSLDNLFGCGILTWTLGSFAVSKVHQAPPLEVTLSQA